MTVINITDLDLSGFDLLSDKESYLNEINDDELNSTRGGTFFAFVGGFFVSYEVVKFVKERV